MRKLLTIVSFLALPCLVNAQFTNGGVDIGLSPDALMTIDMDVNNYGEINHEGKIVITKNWYNHHLGGGLTSQSSGVVELTGSNQIIGGSYSGTFPRVILSGDGIKSLQQNLEITQSLSLGQRELAVGIYQLTLSSKVPEALDRINGFISTEQNGYFYRKLDVNKSYSYPMGSQNSGFVLYRPVSIMPKSTDENIGVSLVKRDPDFAGFDRNFKKTDISEINSRYYHVLNKTAGNSPVEISFYYNEKEEEPLNELGYWSSTESLWKKADHTQSFTGGSFNLDKTLTLTATELQNLPIALVLSGGVNNLVFYNSYTPDGDGKNDTWNIGNIDNYPDNEITILNRWGGEVFRTKSFSSTNSWDGSGLNDGTYYYLLKVKINGKEEIFKGFISLVKN